MAASKDQVEVQTAPAEPSPPPMASTNNPSEEESGSDIPADRVDRKEKGFLAYFKTKEHGVSVSPPEYFDKKEHPVLTDSARAKIEVSLAPLHHTLLS